jgi:hypothetical protein
MRVEASAVSETTKQDASASGSCVQRKFVPAPIWTEAMLAALQTGVKGGKWHSLIDKVSRLEALELGWAQVERNAGAARVDRISVERFAQARDCYLGELASALRDGTYAPQPVRRVYIPKGKGQRPLGIPAVKDRVVQAALKLVIEPIFEHEFEPPSCAGSSTARVRDDAYAITNNGRIPSSLILGCSRCAKPIAWRANPDEDTTDWRARRGRTAHRVRREGTVSTVPYPYCYQRYRIRSRWLERDRLDTASN